MATSATPLGVPLVGGRCLAWDIIADADADTTLNIVHGIQFALSVNPARVVRITLMPLGAKFYDQKWLVTQIIATLLVLTKSGIGAGSGDAASQCRVFLEYMTS